MSRNQLTKQMLVALFVTINLLLSQFVFIPLGPIKAQPMQHMINVLCAVFVGPWYGLFQAFLSSTLRNMFHIGTLFAFPGSMIGALLSGLLFKYTKRLSLASLGEWIGTGLLGSICTLPLMYIMNISFSKFMPIFYAFLASSLVGSIIAFFIIKVLMRQPQIKKYLNL